MADPVDSDVESPADDDSEWRFSIDAVGPDAEDDADDTTIEPESISLEHATFVVLGVLLTLGVVVTGL